MSNCLFQERSLSDANNQTSVDETDDANHCMSKPIDISRPGGTKSKSGSLLGTCETNLLIL